jgi:hypothetical protein
MSKPRTAAGYSPEQVAHVRATCLYLATKLGDLSDDLVVVGGLVPSLIVDQHQSGRQSHVGTLDLDVGLAVALLNDHRYEALAARLRESGFEPDTNDEGNRTNQRWKIDGTARVTLDFLMPPSKPEDRGGRLRHLQADFAAIIAPGLRLAFRDRIKVPLSGTTIMGARAAREIWVCGPGAFVAMKALAFRIRGANKDAYDLVYTLRNYGAGIQDVASVLAPLRDDSETGEALAALATEFEFVDSTGPVGFSAFLHGMRHEEAATDAWSAVRELLDRLAGA